MTYKDNPDGHWMDDAACTGDNVPHPDTWFPPRDKALYTKTANLARSYCFGSSNRPECPVRRECLWQAISTDEQHGIWGGLSHRERNAMVRKWQKVYRHKMTLEEFVYTYKEKENGNSK